MFTKRFGQLAIAMAIATLFTMIRNGMNLMEVSQFKQMMAIGAVVIVAVWIDVVRRKHLLKKLNLTHTQLV